MRSVAEWIADNDDQVPPPRVRLRVFDGHGGKCHACGRKVMAGEYWVCEHMVALINGGQNRESNLDVTCRNCLAAKNASDVAEKSKLATIRKKHALPKPKKPLSKWKRTMSGKVVLREKT